MRTRVAGGDRFWKGSPAMSVGSVRLLLWLALAIAMPVPIWLLGPGSVPVGHLFELGAAALAFGIAESFRGVVGLTALVFLSQALVYAALLYAVAAAIARGVRRFPGLVLILAASLVVAACLVPIYHSPYHAQTAQVTLLGVYQ
jgi:hypothetical protein